MAITKQAFMNYVNAGQDLAELLKKNIQKGGSITNETVLALNEFIISYNEIADLVNDIEADDDDNETDPNFN